MEGVRLYVGQHRSSSNCHPSHLIGLPASFHYIRKHLRSSLVVSGHFFLCLLLPSPISYWDPSNHSHGCFADKDLNVQTFSYCVFQIVLCVQSTEKTTADSGNYDRSYDQHHMQ